MEDWKKRLGSYDSMNEAIFITIDGETIYTIDNLVDFIEQEIEKAREERTQELKRAFYEVFYKSGELWFDYLFEDGDTESEQDAKGVVEEYWKEILSKLTTK